MRPFKECYTLSFDLCVNFRIFIAIAWMHPYDSMAVKDPFECECERVRKYTNNSFSMDLDGE